MKKGKQFMVLGLGLLVFMGGCGNINDTNIGNKEEKETTTTIPSGKQNSYEEENFVSIQTYNGEGYTLRDGSEETKKLADAHKDEIEKATKAFFLEKYKTEVVVHNMVGAKDGATIFVESVGEPHFYTFAIVPINVKEKEVNLEEIWTQEGQVENAISTGLYAMAYEEEFANLDRYLENVASKYPVTGTPIEALENVGAKGYATTNYYVNSVGEIFDEAYSLYIQNPNITKEELRVFFQKEKFQPDDVIVTIYLYMKEIDVEPDQTILNLITSDIESMQGIPRGSYSVVLNDNYVDKRRAIGIKDNTVKRTFPNEILKE